jgi:tetratricopeptide (TPR) repeat protein
LQDRIARHTMAAISPRLEEAEIARSRHKPTGSLDAYDCFLRGRAGLHLWTRQGTDDALQYFRRAFELDPEFAAACGLAARTYTLRKAMNWMVDEAAEAAEAVHLSERAAELGREDAVALGTAGFALTYIANRFDDGDLLTERAIQLNPNFAWGWFFSAFIKAVSGEPDMAIERSSRALQLSPHDPHLYSFELSFATAHFIAGRYTETLAHAEKVSRMQPERFSSLAFRAASLAQLGRLEEARIYGRMLLILEPAISLANLARRFPIKRDEDFRRWRDGLRLAGVPE